MRGWFKESYRHYLAAKGIPTAYFKRKPKTPPWARATRPKKGTKTRLPIPTSKRTLKELETGKYPPEDIMKRIFVRQQPKEVQEEYFAALQQLRDVDERIKDIEAELVPVSKLERERKYLMDMLKVESDEMMRKEMEKQIEDVNEQLEVAKVSAKREELSKLRKEKTALKDRIDEIEGVQPRAIVHPGGLTREQLERRALRGDPMLNPEDVAKMSREELQRIVAEKAPVLRPREKILGVERPEMRKRLEAFQEKLKQLQPEGAKELQTVTKPGTKGGREPVEKAVERMKEREEKTKAALAAAREARRLSIVPQRVQKDIEGAMEEEEYLKRTGQMTPLKSSEKKSGDEK